jgi:hypothetical protein
LHDDLGQLLAQYRIRPKSPGQTDQTCLPPRALARRQCSADCCDQALPELFIGRKLISVWRQ